LNDGAAALLLVSEQGMRLAKGDPLGRFVTSAVVGCDPTFMGEGPIPATKQALARAEWRLGDVDLVELNEAFAVQALACVRGLDADLERVNVHGGAIALGHPIGASGARIVVTLLHALRRHGKTRGLCTLCVGVGQGMTALFER
jgi:acetyl-CoA acetyltransferase family protein